MNKLFVGNLDFRLTENVLEMFIQECGIQVQGVKIIRDSATNRSRGFGFVELGPGQDLDDAIEMLDGKILEGRPLRVNRAQERRGGPPHRGGGPRPGGRHDADDRWD